MPTVLVAGAAVQDFIYRFDVAPARGTKGRAREFTSIGGGSGANAAVTVVRLGGRGQIVAPLGLDPMGDVIGRGLEDEGVDVSKLLRLPDHTSPVCAAVVDAQGERTILTYHASNQNDFTLDDPDALVADVDAVLTDDRHPCLAIPLLAAARRRGIPGILDADRAEGDAPRMIEIASHVVFGTPGLRGNSGRHDLTEGLRAMRATTDAFLAVTMGADGVRWLDGEAVRHLPGFRIEAVDTLGAGDTFHGAFALAIAEGQAAADALRFASATAALKCSRFGGRLGIPTRDEVEALLAAPTASDDRDPIRAVR